MDSGYVQGDVTEKRASSKELLYANLAHLYDPLTSTDPDISNLMYTVLLPQNSTFNKILLLKSLYILTRLL